MGQVRCGFHLEISAGNRSDPVPPSFMDPCRTLVKGICHRLTKQGPENTCMVVT